MTPFLTAVAFLTRLPVPESAAARDMRAVSAARMWFPAVGLLIGVLLFGIDEAARRALPDASAAVIVVVALAAITGALHLDGLADAADGLFGGHDRAARLAIMHDVHAGTFAIVAVTGVLALKWAGVAALPDGVRGETLVLAPCLARFAMLAAIEAFPYAREDGMGTGLATGMTGVTRAVGAATAIIAAVALLGPEGAYALACAAACAAALGFVTVRMLGGMTGDVYGATVEVTEAAALLFIAAFANRGWITGW